MRQMALAGFVSLMMACGDSFVPGEGGDAADMAALADLATSGPCAGVACGAGRCEVVGMEESAAPSCVCDAGFIPQGLTCVQAPATPAIAVNITGAPITTEAGGRATLSIQLSRQPTHAVTIPVKLSRPTIAAASAGELIFIPEVWNIPQTLTITGIDDGMSGSESTYFVLLGPATSQDAGFMGLEAAATLTSQDTRCGDGMRNGAEQCDPPSASQFCAYGQSSCTVCDASCRMVSGQPGGRCGDGILHASGGEQCDGSALQGGAACPAGTTGTPGCDGDCKLDLSACATAVASIWAGNSTTCAIKANKQALCWGANQGGIVGPGESNVPAPAPLTRLGGANALAIGQAHLCALTPSGGVKCWGENRDGQLGDGTTQNRREPVDVSGLTSGVKSISAGRTHVCAVMTSGGVKCWGDNQNGQLGNGSTSDSPEPVDVGGLSGVQSVAAGSSHTCALLTGGAVRCWGANSRGQLGDGSDTNRRSPVAVQGLSDARAIAAGTITSCAALTSGAVKCWGSNQSGQLGDGTTDTRYTPDVVSGLSDVKALSMGELHVCAVTNAGGVKCWGNNQYGQLGDGTTTLRTTPVNVTGLQSGVKFAPAGYNHTCAVLTSGGARCWGSNANQQIGDDDYTNRTTPTRIVGIQ